MAAENLGPAFDSNTLIRQTQRKLVTLWMEDAGCDTLIVPAAWAELTRETTTRPGMTSARRWKAMQHMPNCPYRLLTLTDEQDEAAEAIRHTFTEACFPQTTAQDIARNSDAVIISQALAVGTDALITNDTRSIDHRAINEVIHRTFRTNVGYVLTLDNALLSAFEGGEPSERLLALALASTAPDHDKLCAWSVEQAATDLAALRRALLGANMVDTANRLDARWQLARDLDAVLGEAVRIAKDSNALRWERLRSSLGQSTEQGD